MTEWRLLLTGPGEPGFNMALDEALSVAIRRGWSPPTLRIYRWQQPAVSLGCHQPASVLEAFPQAMVRGAVVVRRPTAGGAVFHTGDVSYALVCGSQRLRGHPSRQLYQRFHAALRDALSTPGARRYVLSRAPARATLETSVCFRQPVAYDVMCGPTKVAGASQRLWRDGLLQQGTVVDPAASADRLALCIRAAWAAVFSCRFVVGALTAQEHLLADELWSKYRPWMPSSWPPVSQSALNR